MPFQSGIYSRNTAEGHHAACCGAAVAPTPCMSSPLQYCFQRHNELRNLVRRVVVQQRHPHDTILPTARPVPTLCQPPDQPVRIKVAMPQRKATLLRASRAYHVSLSVCEITATLQSPPPSRCSARRTTTLCAFLCHCCNAELCAFTPCAHVACVSWQSRQDACLV